VLPCVDVFLADELYVWATILRTCLALRCGAQLADVRTCLAFALRTCVGVPNLRMCLALRWGAQPWWGRIKKCTSKPKFVLIHPPARLLAQFSLVWTFSLRMSFVFGRPCCGRAFHCDVAPNLRTCGRALRLCCGRALGRPTCRRALHCVGAPNLRTCLVLRLGAHLADVPCFALGCPTLGRPY
jgi:hypothetical protein